MNQFNWFFIYRSTSSSRTCREHSASTLHQAAKQVPADQGATTQADSGWREPACRRAFIQLAVFSNRTKKSKSARPTKVYTLTKQLNSADAMREALAFVSNLNKIQRCSLSSLRTYMHAASRVVFLKLQRSWHFESSVCR